MQGDAKEESRSWQGGFVADLPAAIVTPSSAKGCTMKSPAARNDRQRRSEI
jgi:hypothetical protein